MSNSPSARVLAIASLSVVLLIGSLVTPPFAASGDGFAAASAAALTFLALFALSVGAAIYVAVFAWRRRAELGAGIRLVAFAPLLLTLCFGGYVAAQVVQGS